MTLFALAPRYKFISPGRNTDTFRHILKLVLTLWRLTTPYRGRTAPLTSKVAFCIFIEQI